MRRCVPFALLIILVLTVASTPSYWFSQLQVKPDAQQAQEFWFVPGTGVTFTYQTNHVIINNSGTNIATATNALNWSGSNAMNTLILSTSNTLNNTVLSSSNVLNNTILSSSNVLNNTILSSSNTLNNTILSSSNVLVTIATTNAWHLNGNTLGQSNSFLGTIDLQPIQFKVNNRRIGLLDTNDSVAILYSSTASGMGSIAIGSNSLASGVASTAVGQGTIANQNGATALGILAQATAISGTAIGQTANCSASGAVAIGAGAVASGPNAVALGPSSAAAANAFATGGSCAANAPASVAMGSSATAQNDGSFVWADSGGGAGFEDVNFDQWSIKASGGVYFFTAGSGLRVDEGSPATPVKPITLLNGIATISDKTISTNGYYYVATNNGIAAALQGLTPLHAWATLSGWSAAASPLINPGATTINTYYPITNYARIVTNLWRAFLTKTNGVLMNDLPGWYKISFSVSARATANEQLEVDVVTNGVNTDYISAHGSVGTGGNDTCMSGVGRLWIPANTKVSLSMQNSTAGHTMTISHVQLDVGP